MNFGSDNVAGAHPKVLEALSRHNAGAVESYGDDPLTRAVEERLRALFEAPEAAVFLVATGTAANALALSALAPPYGEVHCHAEAHIQVDECGAPEFFTGGAKLELHPGAHGKLEADSLAAALGRANHGVHHVKAAALSLTQATCAGTVYSVDETRALCAVARDAGLRVHMDGARLANALVTLGCRPAEATWRAGVDALCFGATKNGALAAEAVILFDPALAESFAYRRKRGGHLLSKMRFLAAQMEAYLDGDLWRANATHANAMAARLAAGLERAGHRLAHPVEANEVFVEMDRAAQDALRAGGAGFHAWPSAGRPLIRLVCAFDTRPADVDRLLDLAGKG